MKKIKAIFVNQKGSVTIEAMAAIVMLLMGIVFLMDLFFMISVKGKVERTSYSLLNIVKERHVINKLVPGSGDSTVIPKAIAQDIQNIGSLLIDRGSPISYFVEVVNFPHEKSNYTPVVDQTNEQEFSWPIGTKCRPRVLLADKDSGLFNGNMWQDNGRRAKTDIVASSVTALTVDGTYTPVYRITVCVPYQSAFAKIFKVTGVIDFGCGSNVMCASSVGIAR